jgi:hypothetical protein
LSQPFLIVNKTDGFDPPQIATGPDAPCAANAQVVVPDEEGMIVNDRNIGRSAFGSVRRNADVVDHILKFTVPELSAAPLVLRNIGGALAPAASFLLSTGETRMAMAPQDGNQVLLPLRLDPFILYCNHHPLPDLSSTGSDKVLFTLHLHNTEPTSLPLFLG